MALVEPAAFVHGLEKAPDVLDVRVREGVVVVVPVHPHPEPAGLLGDHLGEVSDALPALGGELGEAVLLDFTLGVEAQRLLDFDLHPEPLTVEAVLIALLEPPERLVSLEDVLERAAPGVVDPHRVVGRDRAVDEAPPRPVGVALPKPVEDALGIPPLEDLLFERGMIGHCGKRIEHLVGHAFDFTEGREQVSRPGR